MFFKQVIVNRLVAGARATTDSVWSLWFTVLILAALDDCDLPFLISGCFPAGSAFLLGASAALRTSVRAVIAILLCI